MSGLPVGLDTAIEAAGEPQPIPDAHLQAQLGLVTTGRLAELEQATRRAVDFVRQRVVSPHPDGGQRKAKEVAPLCEAERRLYGDPLSPGHYGVERRSADARHVEQIDMILGGGPSRLEAGEAALNPDFAPPRSTLRLRARHGEQRQAQYYGES